MDERSLGFTGPPSSACTTDGNGAIAGDGQVTFGEATIIKHGARKVRRLAGTARSSPASRERPRTRSRSSRSLKSSFRRYHGNLHRAAVELAKEWRTDRVLRRLEALLVVLDASGTLL